ncbi:MAG: DUF2207 domain-containing protein [Elusimicrobiota bacterium]|jgi:uncharacterized membrane protein YgcG|nr:DUF2207 domain-containing protein [Elusimicrobiota bacterium]
MKKLSASLIFCFLTINLLAQGVESIIRFHSKMSVHAYGSAQIEETIKINAQHQDIKRGIYRDIPKDKLGKIEPQNLFMDGEPHPYFTENQNKTLRINFGDDNYITTGEHIYKLIYNVQYAVSPFKNYDEVYWNVTGSDWNFPIEKASFELVLPQGVKTIDDKISLYTGTRGSKESFAKRVPIDGRLIFETAGILPSGSGFTVAVPFQKGIVNIKIPLWQNQFLQTILLVMLFIIVLIYMYWAYNKVGRDPKDTIVTEFKPPKDISPAFMRYFLNRNFDTKIFAVALASLAMKGAISIKSEKSFVSGGKTIIEKLQMNAPVEELSPEEENIINFFGEKTTLGASISTEEKQMLAKRIKEIEKEMKERNKQYRVKNNEYLILPLVIFGIATVLCFWLNNLFGDRLGNAIFVVLAFQIFAIFKQNISYDKKSLIGALFVYGGLFVFLCRLTVYKLVGYANLVFFVYFMLIASYIFALLIDNVTEQGRRLTAHIKGFKRYMETAEKYRAELSDPTDAEKIFCDYLPYAFALDMENKWMAIFSTVLSAAVLERSLSHIGGASALSSGSFMSGLNSSLSSSGAGGGGSSGGGRGGGGGGGR